jgi:hypothetical protein
MIENPNPFELAATGLWIVSLEVTPEQFTARVMPWDGVANKLAGNPADAREITVANAPIIAALFAQIGRVAGRNAADVRFLRVSAADPTAPVTAEAGLRGVPEAVVIQSMTPRVVADGVDVIVVANGQQNYMHFAATPSESDVQAILEAQASAKAESAGEQATWQVADLFALVSSDPELAIALGTVYAFVDAAVKGQ